MAQQIQTALSILRRKQVQSETGYPRSTLYWRISQGLYTRPIRLGARAVGWPKTEVDVLNAARIAGVGDDAIRSLVARLEAQRASTLQRLTCGTAIDASGDA